MKYSFITIYCLFSIIFSCTDKSNSEPASKKNEKTPKDTIPSPSIDEQLLDGIQEEASSIKEPVIFNKLIVGLWMRDSIKYSDGKVVVWEPNDVFDNSYKLDFSDSGTVLVNESGVFETTYSLRGEILTIGAEFKTEVLTETTLVLRSLGSTEPEYSYFHKVE